MRNEHESLAFSQKKNVGQQFRTRSDFFRAPVFRSARANLGINYSRNAFSRENAMKKTYLFVGPAAGRTAFSGSISTPNVNARVRERCNGGENDAKPRLNSLLNQDEKTKFQEGRNPKRARQGRLRG